jgi:hypothetical protein
MIGYNPITELLAAPLSPDWTVEGLTEQLLCAVASQPAEEAQEFILDVSASMDQQSRRLFRPLLACLATRSATESGLPANLYGGCLSFKRNGPKGPIWIVGEFDNRPGSARVTLRRSDSPPEHSETNPGERATPMGVAATEVPHEPAAQGTPAQRLE